MCGTCKYFLGFFQAAAIFSGILLIVLLSMFYLYGGLPPTFSMQIGFWVLYTVGWLSIYLTFYIVRVLGRGLFTSWTPRYCLVVIIIIVIMYFTATICLFIPVNESRMVSYTSWYNRTQLDIPDFLDKFQDQYDCCGIHNYKDYRNPNILGSRKPLSKRVDRLVDVKDPDVADPNSHIVDGFEPMKETLSKNKFYYNVPYSCCNTPTQAKFGETCGEDIFYDKINKTEEGTVVAEEDAIALTKINNVTQGCLDKYNTIMKNTFQLNWLIGILSYGTLFQTLNYVILIWIYRVSLKAMRRTFEEQLTMLKPDDDVEAIPEHVRREWIHMTASATNNTEEDNKSDVVKRSKETSKTKLKKDKSNTKMQKK